MTGLIIAALAAVVSFTLAQYLRNRNFKREENLDRLGKEDYHQRAGP
jgi:hypothetical protein